jgi:hypothetical protein
MRRGQSRSIRTTPGQRSPGSPTNDMGPGSPVYDHQLYGVVPAILTVWSVSRADLGYSCCLNTSPILAFTPT